MRKLSNTLKERIDNRSGELSGCPTAFQVNVERNGNENRLKVKVINSPSPNLLNSIVESMELSGRIYN